MSKKKVSFEDIRSSLTEKPSITPVAPAQIDLLKELSSNELDSSHFKFDTRYPSEILIAGSSGCDAGSKSCVGCAGSGSGCGSTDSDGGSAGGSAGGGGDAGCCF